MPASRVRWVLPCALLVSLLTACGGEGSGPISLPSRTGSGLPSRTATAPTDGPTSQPTRPSRPTQQPTQPTQQPTQPPTQQPTQPPTQPTQPPTRPTEQPTTPDDTATAAPPPASASPEPTDADQGDQDSDGTQWWWWLVLALVVIGAIIGALLWRRSRRRRAWLAELATAEQEVGWFGRDLVPQLRGSGSVEAVAGGWAVAVPRVTALDDQLTRLVTSAPGEQERARATAVQGAVRDARDRIAALVAGGGSATWSLDLDSAQAPLLAVLVPPGQATGQAPGS
jgi:hypothetical protein